MNKDTTSIMKHLSLVTEIGLQMVACVGIGFGLGYAADAKFNISPMGLISGTIIGVLAGFWSVYKTIMKTIK